MTGRDLYRIDIFRKLNQLIELEKRIAGDARTRRETGSVTVDEWAHDVAFELILEINDVEGKAELDCDRACIV